jgi:integrase
MPSIEKRGEAYRLVVEAGYDAKGKRIKRYKTIRIDQKLTPKKLKEHLQKELLAFQSEVESGTYIAPTRMTFETFAVNEWLPKYAEKKFSPLTLHNYKDHLERSIYPAFGHKLLHEIKPMHIVSFLSELEKQGTLSSGTILYLYKVLKSVFNKAFDWRLIPNNPMIGVDRPKEAKKKMRFYDEADAQAVIAALEHEPTKWRLYFLGAMLGGFRRGELVALEWPEVDFESNTIRVIKSISLTTKGEAQEKRPKTETSEREVDMPEWYMQELKAYRQQWEAERDLTGNEWKGGDRQYVFHNGYGKPYYYNTPSMVWRRFIQRHSLPEARLHDLRHTAATLLIESETDLKIVQERLGHTKYSTTADLYAHVTKKMKKTVADRLDKFRPQTVPNV